jgi:hypothetical protein
MHPRNLGKRLNVLGQQNRFNGIQNADRIVRFKRLRKKLSNR